VRLRRRAGRPVPPHMDEVYADLHRLTELVLLLAGQVYWPLGGGNCSRVDELIAHLRERLAAQEKELEVGPPP
jgi:hypothetical protein